MTLSLVCIAAALAISIIGTRMVLSWLERRQILDHPNERSSHTRPTPRGGGLAVSAAVLISWCLVAIFGEMEAQWIWSAIGAGTVLMMASWLDDRINLPAGPRFGLHAIAVIALLLALPSGTLVFQGLLPLWLDRLVVFIGWLWFINLYNFMDGIDGITGIETACLGIGISLTCLTTGSGLSMLPLALSCAAAGAGFLIWNWHPARIFLGDVGSVPLGLLLGGLLVWLAISGHVVSALILPGYYLADATITLGRRAMRGEKIWQAHRQHFYQWAVRGGKTHAQVSRLILLGNMGLIMCALIAAQGFTLIGGLSGLLVVAAMLATLQIWSRGATP